MQFQDLHTAVMRYFGDMSRPALQTRHDLLALSAECQSLAATLETVEPERPATHAAER